MSGIQVRMKCPVCPPEKSASLSINSANGLYFCFRCGLSGKAKGKFTRTQLSEEIKRTPEKIEWPPFFSFLDPMKEDAPIGERFALRYLRKREITDYQIEKYKIGYCSEGPYEGRVIVPVMNGPNLIYFVARTISKVEGRKYLNPKTPKAGVLFKTFVGKARRAAIVEGVFDALRTEQVLPSVALLCKRATEMQLKELSRCVKHGVLLLDSDALKDMIPLADEIGYHIPISRAYLPAGDPGSSSIRTLEGVLCG